MKIKTKYGFMTACASDDPRLLTRDHKADLREATVSVDVRELPRGGDGVWVVWCVPGGGVQYPLHGDSARGLARDLRTHAGYAASAFDDGPRRPPEQFLRVPADLGHLQSWLRVDATWPSHGEPLVVLGTGPALVLTHRQALRLADAAEAAAAGCLPRTARARTPGP